MKIKHLILFGSIALSRILIAQNPSFEWANQLGGSNYEIGTCMSIDASGNLLITGSFENTVDFDPGAGVQTSTSAGSGDIFILKLDIDGNLLWTKQIGGTQSDCGYAIATDSGGNIITTGYFMGTVDFDPDTGVQNLTSSGSRDVFILKLDADGNLIWVKQIGGPGLDFGVSIAITPNDDIYTAGHFNENVDFDPSTGVQNITSAGRSDIFIQKLDAEGNFLWAKQIGGPENASISPSITTDISGGAIVTSSFAGTVDFNPGPSVQNLTTGVDYFDLHYRDIFILKLDLDGNFIWVKQMKGNGENYGFSIITDLSGNIYSTGRFASTVDFDPGPDVLSLTSRGSHDIYVQKLDPSGNILWVKQMGSEGGDAGRSITIGIDGDVYTTGYFRGTASFNPSTDEQNSTSVGGTDIFVQKLDTDGNFLWAKSMGGNKDDVAFSITTSASGAIFTTGHFEETANLGIDGALQYFTSAGDVDIFIQKLSEKNIAGLSKQDTGTDFAAYPNPINNQFTIEFNDVQTKVEINIIDVRGMLVSSFSYKNTAIIVHEFNKLPGVYFAEIITPKSKNIISLVKK